MLGSRKNEVTRKNERNVFPTSTLGEPKSRRPVAASISPATAKIDARLDRHGGERLRHPRREGRAADGGEQHGEREQEEGEEVDPDLQARRPEQREAGEAEEGRCRDRDRAGQRRHLLAPQRAPRERERGGSEHCVEREQPAEVAVLREGDEEAVLGVELEGRTKRGDAEDDGRDEGGVADEPGRACGEENDAGYSDRHHGRPDRVGGGDQEPFGGPEGGEAGEEEAATVGDEDEHCPGRAEQRSDFSCAELVHAPSGPRAED